MALLLLGIIFNSFFVRFMLFFSFFFCFRESEESEAKGKRASILYFFGLVECLYSTHENGHDTTH